MQATIREELQALRQIAKEFNERLERLARLVETQETEGSHERPLSLEEEFRQKYPNFPVPKLLKWAGSVSVNAPEDDWKVIRCIAIEQYRKRHENPD